MLSYPPNCGVLLGALSSKQVNVQQSLTVLDLGDDREGQISGPGSKYIRLMPCGHDRQACQPSQASRTFATPSVPRVPLDPNLRPRPLEEARVVPMSSDSSEGSGRGRS